MASLLTQPILFYLQILGLLIASVCVPVISGGGVVEAREQREFDYFVLALQWPGTFCRRTHHCCSSNDGLWSNYNDGTWPACCTGSNFDIKEISTLLDALEKYWPSLSCGSSSTCHGGKGLFWAHEPRDCVIGFTSQDDIISSKSSCPKYVSLPAFASVGLENGGAAFSWLPQHEAL
ncbi:hypothetical protein HYC85_031571 [Camellia sinensis]|uniref:Uncharacterized protein n=1 Tax=Camellia sinensis TaxID=4442 RepID=A0A7J7FSL8_CAMSI|nr:hypothetical protein HYC85_031571 [Camellia sinensis]